MKFIVFSLFLTSLGHAAELVKFADDLYAIEFPDPWLKAESPSAGSVVARENPEGSALMAINLSRVPDGSAADLDATAKTTSTSIAKALGITTKPRINQGKLDGLDTRFVTLEPDDDSSGLGIFLVYIDGKTHLISIQTTLALPARDATREACLSIVKSFKKVPAK